LLEATYTGRFAHHLLQEIDLSQPLDLVDPGSKTDYFAAAQALSKQAYAGTPITSVQKIPYWENMFPQAAGANLLSGGSATNGTFGTIPCSPPGTYTTGESLSATQNIYDEYACFVANETTSLEIMDAFCYPACAGNGTPFQYYQDQFSSLYGWQTRGNSNYNGLQISLRHAMAAGLQFDFNYVYSKSIDVGSNAERVNGFESSGLAFNSQVINAFTPDLWRAPSDFDTTHQFNANWVWDLPYGRGRHWGSSTKGLVNGILGGWGFNGLYRWTSGFPFSVEAGAGYSTDFELQGSSILTGTRPSTGVFNTPNGPSVFQNPQSITCECSVPTTPGGNAGAQFRATYEGEAGAAQQFPRPRIFRNRRRPLQNLGCKRRQDRALCMGSVQCHQLRALRCRRFADW
jgi:hypothetical protein